MDAIALLERARNGEERALSELLAGAQRELKRMVDLRLDPALRRRLEPADIVQEALLEAARRFPEWRRDERYPFRLWLRLLTQQCLDQARRRHLGTLKRDAGKEQALEEERTRVSSQSVAGYLLDTHTSPTLSARREELRAMVVAALEGLEEADREILVLRHFEGLSNEEAAAELGIEPSAASKRFLRALQRLRPALKALG